ncbi:MAG: sodium:calcium antiporter [Chloroflexota bacterium]
MFSSLPILALIVIFLIAVGVIWVAGIQLSNTTDILSNRMGLGQALGGLILLAFVTNLPELAITATAALNHNVGIAVGNILGGIAVQTVVLVLLDGFGVRDHPLTYRAASLVLVLEGALVIGVLAVAIMGTQLPSSLIFARIGPGALLIAIVWLIGLWLLDKASKGLPWHEQGYPPDSQPPVSDEQQKKTRAKLKAMGTVRAVVIFTIAALATLAGGIALEEAGNEIATHIGLSGVLFGATFLAAATSLPELSTGLASVKNGDFRLAFSDIFGGNAFLPVLFLLATVLSGGAVLPAAHKTDIYLTSLGILLTMVYLWGLIFRPQRQYLRLGLDSIVVLVLYVVGVAGLIAVAHG